MKGVILGTIYGSIAGLAAFFLFGAQLAPSFVAALLGSYICYKNQRP